MSNPELQAELVKRLGEEMKISLPSPVEKIVEKVVETKTVSLDCPFCDMSFTGKGAKYLREHLTSKHGMKGES